MNSPSGFLYLKKCGCWIQAHAVTLALSVFSLLAALVLISCMSTNRALVAPPHIEGATFVGSESCADCHETITKPFVTAAHARLRAKGTNAVEMGCESCHGGGSIHVEAGGGRDNIVNPKRSPEICFDCHLDKRGEFSLPHHHPVPEGKLSCSDCHDPHKGPGVRGMGTTFARADETCVRCHTAQRGPFVFEHEAVREGCTTCHTAHGSVNNKLLTERNQALCLKCHFQQQTTPGRLQIGGFDHTGLVSRGTCWTAGCHEAVHGSQIGSSLRY
jgi:predicted CXXCH cytochrome family protein